MAKVRTLLISGDTVFFRCTNPAVGTVKRVAKDQSWAMVQFLGYPKARKVARKDVILLCPVLNAYLVKRGDAFWSIGLQMDWPEQSHEGSIDG